MSVEAFGSFINDIKAIGGDGDQKCCDDSILALFIKIQTISGGRSKTVQICVTSFMDILFDLIQIIVVVLGLAKISFGLVHCYRSRTGFFKPSHPYPDDVTPSRNLFTQTSTVSSGEVPLCVASEEGDVPARGETRIPQVICENLRLVYCGLVFQVFLPVIWFFKKLVLSDQGWAVFNFFCTLRPILYDK